MSRPFGLLLIAGVLATSGFGTDSRQATAGDSVKTFTAIYRPTTEKTQAQFVQWPRAYAPAYGYGSYSAYYGGPLPIYTYARPYYTYYPPVVNGFYYGLPYTTSYAPAPYGYYTGYAPQYYWPSSYGYIVPGGFYW